MKTKDAIELFDKKFGQHIDNDNGLVSQYVKWLYNLWDAGSITISEYRTLLRVDIIKAIRS